MADEQKIKILIVEDEDIVARMYEKTLGFEGFDVTVCLSGSEALPKAKSLKPDIILLDIMMPEPDGLEILEVLKKDPETNHIPIVMLTNLSGKQDIELALSKGALEYWVKKDARPKELAGKISEIVNASKKPEHTQ